MISDTRPSRFSARNIEKLGRAWGRGYIIAHMYSLANTLFAVLILGRRLLSKLNRESWYVGRYVHTFGPPFNMI